MQVANLRYGSIEGRALCFPGGALMSEEEHKWVAEHPDEKVPDNLFYMLAQKAILGTGHFGHYPDWQVRERDAIVQTLSRNALRELREELGEEAASKISLEEIFPGARCTNLSTISFPSVDRSQEIAEKYADRGVVCNGKSLSHIFTTVEEYFGIATTPYLDRIAQTVKENEETYCFDVLDIPTILVRGKRAVTEPGAHNDIGEYDLRNPSTAAAMVRLMEFFKKLIEAQDPYIEGPRRESKY